MNTCIKKIVFHNPNNNYCVLKCIFKNEEIDVVGFCNQPAAGLNIKLQGEWINDATYGKQFKASIIEIILPKTKQGLINYLSCGRIKGIGPQLAKLMVDTFDLDVIDIIDNQPEKLSLLPGIGEKKIAKLIESWQHDKLYKETSIFLQSMGISNTKVDRICDALGSDTIRILKRNPYLLSQKLNGFGFRTCDQIAIKLGLDKDSPERILAYIKHFLDQKAQDGHCWSKLSDAIEDTQKNLALEMSLIQKIIVNECPSNIVKYALNDETVIALKYLHDLEKHCSELMYRRFKQKHVQSKIPVHIDSFKPTDEQVACVEQALKQNTSVITGGPGVGKTTLVKTIIQSMLYSGYRVSLCAPTGRAAKRLQESTRHEAKTIHRLLDYDPISGHFKKDLSNPLSTDCLIVDEASMIDIRLFFGLIQAIHANTKLIFVGDIDQLPSIGPGAILKDLIETFPMYVIRLTQIFRQSKDSLIITNAHRVNNNKLPIQKDDADFYVIENDDPSTLQRQLIKVVSERIPKRFNLDPIRDIQVLTPMKKGILGSQSINHTLAQILNPNPIQQITFQNQRYAVGDKIIVQRNNYEKEIFNGDIGYITYINDSNVGINIENKPIDLKRQELEDILPAYAITIHKSQGSEYPAVVIPIGMQHYMMLNKNLLYTAMTRGKELVVILCQRKALIMSVKNNKDLTRQTNLVYFLSSLMKEQTTSL
ncbi:MAG: ATP-dependent RecD-like DNA helicase [Gammaproteobacteria bacterium]|nr:ATP-dependent RecD-like DNA helicase [Gammaproteobacteria bacterium]